MPRSAGKLVDLGGAVGLNLGSRPDRPGDFPAGGGFLDGVALIGQGFRQMAMEHRLKVRGIAVNILHLGRLPLAFHLIESGVEDEGVCMHVWIGDAIDRACGEVDMLADQHIARHAVGHLAVFADAGLHGLLHLGQRRSQCQAEGIEDCVIAGQGVEQ